MKTTNYRDMTYKQAIKAVQRGQNVELVTKDATLAWHVRKPVWLSDDGYLAMSHPTDPRGGEIGAPEDGRYEPVTDPEEEERSYDEYVRQQDARFAARR